MYLVSRDGRQYGPYSADSIRTYLASGSLLSTDTICEQGSSVWKPIHEVFPAVAKGIDGQANLSESSRVEPPTVRRRKYTIAALIMLLILIVCSAAYFTFFPLAEQVMLLEGSTTIGDVLAPKLLVSFLRSEGATDIVELQGTGAEKWHHDVRAKWPGHWRPVVYTIVANGSGNAFKALATSRAQIGMSSRPIKNEEVVSLTDKGDMRSPRCETIVGLDGLALIVNNSNPVTQLTRQQVASIYSGRITDWSQVGGHPGHIALYGRDSSSGTFDTFVALILAGEKNLLSTSLHIKDNGEAIASAVSGNPAAIGYVGVAQIGSQKALELSDGPGTTPLLPSAFTVATEDYILSRRLFMYVAEKRDDFTSRFLDFAQGPQGQALVEEVGFVKQTPILETVAIPASAPASYRNRVQGLRRLSLNFRFRSDSANLDTKALADVPRALALLTKNGLHSNIAVLGFADSKGSASQNQHLSEQRATVIGKILETYGIQAQTIGFSSAMPVSDNNTTEGRDKNRRVEIWAP